MRNPALTTIGLSILMITFRRIPLCLHKINIKKNQKNENKKSIFISNFSIGTCFV